MSGVVHVVPVGDLIEHDTRTAEPACVCGPRPQLHQDADAGDRWVLVHHSLDGREAHEREGDTG